MQHARKYEGDESIAAERKRRKAKWKFKYRSFENKLNEIFAPRSVSAAGYSSIERMKRTKFLQTDNL